MDEQKTELTEEQLHDLISHMMKTRRKIMIYRYLFLVLLVTLMASAFSFWSKETREISEAEKQLITYFTDNPWLINRYKLDDDILYYLGQKDDGYFLYKVNLNEQASNELAFGEALDDFILSEKYIFVATSMSWNNEIYDDQTIKQDDSIAYLDESLSPLNTIYQINKKTGEILNLAEFISIKPQPNFSKYVYLEPIIAHDDKLYFLVGNSYESYGSYTDFCVLDLNSHNVNFLTSDIPFSSVANSFFLDNYLVIQEAYESNLVNEYLFDFNSLSFQLRDTQKDISKEKTQDIIAFISKLSD